MDLVPLAPGIYHLRGGSNAGLIVQEGQALLVDTGLDGDTAKKILKAVDSLKVRLVGVIITHAHADHFGGAHLVRQRTQCPVYAPAIEAAIIANPVLEPNYLFSGAEPIAELRNKFILAKPCPVDQIVQSGSLTVGPFTLELIPAPGHAHNQMMVAWGDLCFAGDAFFPPAVLDKYGIPFYVNVDQTLTTLQHLTTLPYRCFAQGHGDAVDDVKPFVQYNDERIRAIRQHALDSLDEPRDALAVLARVADAFRLDITNTAVYYLSYTTIQACLSSLRAAGRIDLELRKNHLHWARK